MLYMAEETKAEHHHSNVDHSTVKMDRIKVLTWIVGIVLVLSIINTIGIFVLDNGSGGTTVTAPQPTNNPTPSPSAAPSRVTVNTEGAPALGQANAKVTIVEFSDFQCPFCGRHFTQTYPQLKANYIDTGKVKLVFKDFPLSFHPQAQKAAEAAHCVREQKGDAGYFAMHDKMFANQQTLSVENEKKWAREIAGVDGAKFDTCLDSGKFAQTVQQGLQEGSAAGVQGTPSFFINGVQISGAQPYSAFQAAIDAELAK